MVRRNSSNDDLAGLRDPEGRMIPAVYFNEWPVLLGDRGFAPGPRGGFLTFPWALDDFFLGLPHGGV